MNTTQQQTLNADVGEGCDDALVMPFLDCANIACGAHAGDENVMQETLRLAKNHGVTVGAHPGYPDKPNFGRKSLALSPEQLTETLNTQIQTLLDLAKAQDITPAYVKPHGALNHDMLQKPNIFATICQVVANINSNLAQPLALMVPTNPHIEEQQENAKQYDLTIWWEVFADRAYEPNGLLRARKNDDAVHADPQTIISQIERIRAHAEIVAIDGSILDVSLASTICVHGDHQPSVMAIRKWAEKAC